MEEFAFRFFASKNSYFHAARLNKIHNEKIIGLNVIAHLCKLNGQKNMANKLSTHFLGYSHDIGTIYSHIDNDSNDNENAID